MSDYEVRTTKRSDLSTTLKLKRIQLLEEQAKEEEKRTRKEEGIKKIVKESIPVEKAKELSTNGKKEMETKFIAKLLKEKPKEELVFARTF